MLIDTHAHLNFNAYKEDSLEILQRSLDNNIWMINVGSQYATSKRAVELAEKYPQGVYAAVGLHPIHANEEEFDYAKYKKLGLSVAEGKVVAIGEIGLDYKSEYVSYKEKQKTALNEQIELAKALDLPIIFHCREAHADLIEILHSRFQILDSKPRGVIHCFTGNLAEAKEYLSLGFYLGFNGIIFKLNLDEVIAKTPLDRILIETDCPYLTPLPMEGRNEPLYVKYVAEKIAKVKNLSYQELSQATTQNAKKLFTRLNF